MKRGALDPSSIEITRELPLLVSTPSGWAELAAKDRYRSTFTGVSAKYFAPQELRFAMRRHHDTWRLRQYGKNRIVVGGATGSPRCLPRRDSALFQIRDWRQAEHATEAAGFYRVGVELE